jgi:hypothetical protein
MEKVLSEIVCLKANNYLIVHLKANSCNAKKHKYKDYHEPINIIIIN